MPGHQRRPSDECEQIVRNLSGMDRPPAISSTLRYHSLDHPAYGSNDPSLSLSAVGSMMQKVSVGRGSCDISEGYYSTGIQ